MVTQIEIPPRIRPDDDSGYLEELTKAIFRAGFSWRVVREKWDAFRRAFDGFDLDRVAAYEAADIARLFSYAQEPLRLSSIVQEKRFF